MYTCICECIDACCVGTSALLRRTCVYIFMYICICVYMYICIYVYMYICIYVYMYTCICE